MIQLTKMKEIRREDWDKVAKYRRALSNLLGQGVKVVRLGRMPDEHTIARWSKVEKKVLQGRQAWPEEGTAFPQLDQIANEKREYFKNETILTLRKHHSSMMTFLFDDLYWANHETKLK